MTTRAKRWKPAKAVDQIVESVFDALKALTPDQREKVYRRINDLSTTNCWWATYRMRNALRDFVEALEEERQLEAARQTSPEVPHV